MQSFGLPKSDAYLASTLVKQGELLQQYYGVASSPLANDIGLLSGQGPTPQTTSGCPVFSAIRSTTTGPFGQLVGQGCVYPSSTLTLADQVSRAAYKWRAYIQSMNSAPKGQQTTCRRPSLNAADASQTARPGNRYVTSTNPFVYFQSLQKHDQCKHDDVALTELSKDLKNVSTTPALSYIARTRATTAATHRA